MILSPQSSYHLEQVTYTKNIHRNPVPRGRANWPTHLLYQVALQRTVERDLGPSYVVKEQQPSCKKVRFWVVIAGYVTLDDANISHCF